MISKTKTFNANSHALDYQLSLTLPVEVDSLKSEFDTEIFRVWYGAANLGVFHKEDGGWITEAFYGNPSRTRVLCSNSDCAVGIIVNGYLVGRHIR